MKNYKFPIAASISNSFMSGNNGQILGFNQERTAFGIQNIGTGVLYAKFGTGAASDSFNIILRACILSGDGSSEPYIDTTWKGPVSVSGVVAAAYGPSYIAWETF